MLLFGIEVLSNTFCCMFIQTCMDVWYRFSIVHGLYHMRRRTNIQFISEIMQTFQALNQEGVQSYIPRFTLQVRSSFTFTPFILNFILLRKIAIGFTSNFRKFICSHKISAVRIPQSSLVARRRHINVDINTVTFYNSICNSLHFSDSWQQNHHFILGKSLKNLALVCLV